MGFIEKLVAFPLSYYIANFAGKVLVLRFVLFCFSIADTALFRQTYSEAAI